MPREVRAYGCKYKCGQKVVLDFFEPTEMLDNPGE